MRHNGRQVRVSWRGQKWYEKQIGESLSTSQSGDGYYDSGDSGLESIYEQLLVYTRQNLVS